MVKVDRKSGVPLVAQHFVLVRSTPDLFCRCEYHSSCTTGRASMKDKGEGHHRTVWAEQSLDREIEIPICTAPGTAHSGGRTLCASKPKTTKERLSSNPGSKVVFLTCIRHHEFLLFSICCCYRLVRRWAEVKKRGKITTTSSYISYIT